jgi:hypothetical protein
MKKILLIFALIGGIGLCCLGLGYYLTAEEPSEQDYTMVEGKFLRAAEKQGTRQPALDIYLEADPLRYRVPIDVYSNGFRKELFFQHCRPGTKLTLAVGKADLDSPFRPPGDQQDTVFVAAVRDAEREYYSLGERIAWLKNNSSMAPVVAAIGAAIAIASGFMLKAL